MTLPAVPGLPVIPGSIEGPNTTPPGYPTTPEGDPPPFEPPRRDPDPAEPPRRDPVVPSVPGEPLPQIDDPPLPSRLPGEPSPSIDDPPLPGRNPDDPGMF